MELSIIWKQHGSELSKKRISVLTILIIRFLREHINPTSKIE